MAVRRAYGSDMLTGIHVLLSYTCLYQCEHCFLHCSPEASGTFSVRRLRKLLHQATEPGTVRTVCFEGGEPLLFYPVLAEGITRAHALGFRTEIVTNAYWAQDAQDARYWLEPLVRAGLNVLNVSDDTLHHGETAPSPAQAARDAARDLGLEHHAFCITVPEPAASDAAGEKGAPIEGGGVRFRGRAAEKLLEGQPRHPWQAFDQCPDEDFRNPGRVHVDAEGHVQLCQGISIGNVWERPLAEILESFAAADDPICGPLDRGGPAELVNAHDLQDLPGLEQGYVDACHLCYEARKALLQQYPQRLAPLQAYGCA